MPVQLDSTDIIQIGVVVRDLEISAARYAAILGLTMPGIFTAQGEPRAIYKGEAIPAGLKGVVFDMGRVQLELLQPLDSPSSWADFLDERGEGIHHIAFGVSNMNDSIASFEQYGYGVLQRGMFSDQSGQYTYMDTEADLGIVIELNQRFDGKTHQPAPFDSTNGIGTNVVTQVALMVHDIESVKNRIAEVFGLPNPNLIITPGYEVVKTTYRGEPCHATAKLAFFNFGQMQLELIEPDPTSSVWRDFLNQGGQRGHHIAFHVPNTARATEILEKHGLPMTQQGFYGDLSGMYTYFDSEAALAVSLELLENFPKE